MGTITRTFANNITTSGVFKPTAFNDASFDNVTAVPSGAVEGGNMVLLSTQTASGDASISFTTGIDSTYKEYMFIFNNIHPSTSANFSFNLSTDGGSSYNVTKTSTNFGAYHIETGTDTLLSYDTSQDLAQSTDYQKLTMGGSAGANDADRSFSGTLTLFNPSNTTYVKHFISNSNFMDSNASAYTVNAYVAGYGNTTSAINAIDFKFASGNIDDGTIQMFGIL
jgi:hypothetical protein